MADKRPKTKVRASAAVKYPGGGSYNTFAWFAARSDAEEFAKMISAAEEIEFEVIDL